MSLLDHDAVRRWLDSRILCEVATDRREVAITFDDGPNPRHTPRLLELCERLDVRVTFFVVGRRVRRFAEVTAQVAATGHEIANHSFHHVPMSALPVPLMRREIENTSNLVESLTGRRPGFFRPPMGWFSPQLLATARAAGCVPAIGTIHPRDSRRPPAREIEERVMRRMAPGAIVILHDGGWRIGCDRSRTIAAFERIVPKLRKDGYRLVTLSELVTGARAPAA